MASNTYKSLHKEAMTMLTGDFNLVITDAKATKNSKQNTMFKLTWAVEDGPHQGHKFYSNLNVTPDSPGAMRMFFGQLATLGLGESFFAGLDDTLTQEQTDILIAQKLVGARALVTVGEREWGGRKMEDVTAIKPPGAMTGGVASPLSGGMPAPAATGPAPSVSPTPPASPAPTATPTAPSAPPATPY